MAQGRYVVMDGDGVPVGTEEFRCAPGPVGWRYFSDVTTSDPGQHDEVVDLVVDQAWRPVRTRIDTQSHELLLEAHGEVLRGFLDHAPLSVPWGPDRHLDYLSPAYNAVTTRRLDGTCEIDVVYLAAVTCAPRDERQRYELIAAEEVKTPVGTFRAARWRYTSLSTGWTRDLWVAGDVVVRFDGLFELEAYEPGASGPRPLARG